MTHLGFWLSLILAACLNEAPKSNGSDSASEVDLDSGDADDTGLDPSHSDSLDVDDDGDGQTENQGDCDDDNPEIFTGAEETCNGIDNNCSGDESDATDALIWFEDLDNDGYGNETVPMTACFQPNGFVDNTDDCNDEDISIHVDAVDTCDGIDSNCSGDESDCIGFFRHENGVTIQCPNAAFGDSADIDGRTYTKREILELKALIQDNDIAAIEQTCTSGITDMRNLFAPNLFFNGDISTWDTSIVVDMRAMFMQTPYFNADISLWETSNVTDMGYMFASTEAFNQNIGSWNTSNVRDMQGMFLSAEAFNQDIGNWETSNVKNMFLMFNEALSFDQDISAWNTAAVTNMMSMFQNALAFNQDLSGWCVSQFSNEPMNFSVGSTSWILPQPVWGTCPP